MRVWQAGSHLTMQRGAEVEDWSWRRTRRRLATLAREQGEGRDPKLVARECKKEVAR